MPNGGTQFIFRKESAPFYHLVTERVLIRDGREWVLSGEYAERRYAKNTEGVAVVRMMAEARKRFDFTSCAFSRMEAVEWFYRRVIANVVPAELHADFAPKPPIDRRELEGEVASTCALLELLAQEIARPGAEETGAFRGKLGDGLLTLATRQGLRLQSAAQAVTK